MTQIIVLLIIVFGNVILGIVAKRYKEKERKRREAEAARDPHSRARSNDEEDEDEDEGFLDIILREAERRTQTERKPSPSAATPSAPANAPPTAPPNAPSTAQPTPTARVGAPPPFPNPTVPTTVPPVTPRPQPSMRVPVRQPAKPELQRRPQDAAATGSGGKAATRPLGALSTRGESPGAKRRRLEHAARVKERAARKLARQEWSRARKARVTKRTSKLSTAAAAAKVRSDAAKLVVVVHPVIAAIRDVFRTRSKLQAAFLVGDILRRRDGNDSSAS